LLGVKAYFDNVGRISEQEIAFLAAAISPTPMKKKQPRLAHPGHWWLEISNLQKCIRRGEVSRAVESACKLHNADPFKLRRRLCVIVLEDICFGDLLLVATVLTFAARFLGRDGAQPDATDLGKCLTLVAWLANATKDRASCEIATASIDPPKRQSEILRIGQLSQREAAMLYATSEEDIRERCVAGWALSGNLTHNQRRIGKRDHALLGAAMNAMNLPGVVRYIVATSLRFGGEISLLAVAIPALYESVTSEHVETRTTALPPAEEIQGVLSPSYDVHTRSGLRALASYVAQCPELRRLCSEGGANPRRVVGAVGFRAEGSAVATELRSPFGDWLHEQNERATCESIGLPYDTLANAKQEFLGSLDTLNALRRRYAASEARSLGVAR
jgi:hypothetical protein